MKSGYAVEKLYLMRLQIFLNVFYKKIHIKSMILK